MADTELKEVVETEAPAKKLPKRGTILAFGILSLALCCDFSILGIIFGFIARGKSKRYAAAGVPVTGSVRVGQVFGTIGGVISIIVTVLTPIIIAGIVVACVALSQDPEVANAVTEFFKQFGVTFSAFVA